MPELAIFKYSFSSFINGDKMPELKLAEDAPLVKRLENVDRELHMIIWELKVKHKKSLSLSELNKLMKKDRTSDADSTELIRGMRDREYGL